MTETGSATTDRSAHVKAAEGAVLRADELIAGYLPGVNILNGSDLYCQEGELVGIIGPNGAGKSTLLKAMFGLVKISSGTVTLKGQDITNKRADALVTAGIGFVPQTNNVFPSLTIAGEPRDGCLPGAQDLRRALRLRLRHLPDPARPARPARRLAVRWRAPDGGDGPGPDDEPRRCCCSTSPPRASPPSCRTRSSCRPGASTGPGSPW